MNSTTFLLLLAMLILDRSSVPEENSVYIVNRLSQPVEINSDWNKEPWENMQPLYIDKHMGDVPDHKPEVQAKVAYDDEAIYVIFQVKDRYVKCVTDQYQGPVFRDSCVEFFFTPGMDISDGYFNLEVNCGGTALFHFQKKPRHDTIRIPESEFDQIQIAHSLPRIVDPEIKKPTTWTIEYRIPFKILTQYFEITHPAPGVEWKANFYKIADRTSHPHWLTWSFVDHPKPNFHLPEFFGTLKFQ